MNLCLPLRKIYAVIPFVFKVTGTGLLQRRNQLGPKRIYAADLRNLVRFICGFEGQCLHRRVLVCKNTSIHDGFYSWPVVSVITLYSIQSMYKVVILCNSQFTVANALYISLKVD